MLLFHVFMSYPSRGQCRNLRKLFTQQRACKHSSNRRQKKNARHTHRNVLFDHLNHTQRRCIGHRHCHLSCELSNFRFCKRWEKMLRWNCWRWDFRSFIFRFAIINANIEGVCIRATKNAQIMVESRPSSPSTFLFLFSSSKWIRHQISLTYLLIALRFFDAQTFGTNSLNTCLINFILLGCFQLPHIRFQLCAALFVCVKEHMYLFELSNNELTQFIKKKKHSLWLYSHCILVAFYIHSWFQRFSVSLFLFFDCIIHIYRHDFFPSKMNVIPFFACFVSNEKKTVHSLSLCASRSTNGQIILST